MLTQCGEETFIPRGVAHHNVGQQGGATIPIVCRQLGLYGRAGQQKTNT